MQVSLICEELMDVINEQKCIKGKVHSVFSNACNIVAGEIFITLLSNNKKMSPMSVQINSRAQVDFIEYCISKDMNFELSVEGIYCLEKDIYMPLREAGIWNSEILSIYENISSGSVGLTQGVGLIEQGIKEHGKLYGIGRLVELLRKGIPGLNLCEFNISSDCYDDKSINFIQGRFLDLVNGIITRDMDNIAVKASKVIGFGAGLTPGVDDFISGLLIINILLAKHHKLNLKSVYEFNDVIISLSLENTTRVSSEMLKHSARGRTNQAVMELFKEILSGDEKNMDNRLIDVMSCGETSGTDMLLGIYVGLKIWTNFDYRRVWLNG